MTEDKTDYRERSHIYKSRHRNILIVIVLDSGMKVWFSPFYIFNPNVL